MVLNGSEWFLEYSNYRFVQVNFFFMKTNYKKSKIKQYKKKIKILDEMI